MRRLLLIVPTLAVSLIALVGSAQAVVVDPSQSGQASVAYNPANQNGYAGVALVPGSRSDLATAGIPTVTSSAPCTDPALSADLVLPDTGLCSHGGAVMHNNEVFAFTWDSVRRYWQSTRDYVQTFLRDVADGSTTLNSPYAVTGQYSDSTGRAANLSVYGGGCIDYGNTGGATCRFGDTDGSGPGHSYSASGCPVTGTNQFHEEPSSAFDSVPNDVCLTDAQLRGELATMIAQTGVPGHTKPGYTPLIVLLMPPGVKTCLDGAGALCSVNGTSSAKFCSYHSHVDVGGTSYAYVVQPWTALTGCDDPGVPAIPPDPTPQELAVGVGQRLVSPLSQGQLAAIVDPGLNGWFGLDGSEINDNGCVPLPRTLDSVTVGAGAQNPYFLQREFNNAGVIESDPNAPECTPSVVLAPTFVAPSAINRGDVVQFDGSTSPSTLIVPKDGYAWSFGDGTTAVGPSVVHSYAAGGTFKVTLTVVDRGANIRSLSQTVTVMGASGQTVPPPPPPPVTHSTPRFRVRLQLMPQGLKSMLHSGVAVQVSSNERADGIVTLSISKSAARQAHIRVGRGATVVVGRGTVSGIKNGIMQLHVRLPRATATKLGRLRRLTVTVRLALVAAGRDHLAIDVAGRY
ncbi:MAG TPA: PKD domain-containing protein [Solirubrobacteraceae bacterium]